MKNPVKILVGGILVAGLSLVVFGASIIGFGAWGLEKLIDGLEPEKLRRSNRNR